MKKKYEKPLIHKFYIELEQGIAASSVTVNPTGDDGNTPFVNDQEIQISETEWTFE